MTLIIAVGEDVGGLKTAEGVLILWRGEWTGMTGRMAVHLMRLKLQPPGN